MEKNQIMKGHIFAIITILIWGTTYISTKVLLVDMKPVDIMLVRVIISIIALLIIYPRRLKTKGWKEEIYFAGAGICGITLYQLMENFALTMSTASNVGVIIAISPFFTAIMSHIFLDEEKLKINFFIGFAFAIVGTVLISFSSINEFKINPMGDILALCCAVIWGGYSILTRKISKMGYNTIQTTRRIFVYALIFMLPAVAVLGFNTGLDVMLKPVNLFNLLFLGIGAAALCFVTWNMALKRLGAVKTSVYIYAIPVIALVTAYIVLGEKKSFLSLVGVVLTLLGLIISEIKRPLRIHSSGEVKTSEQ